MERVETLMSAAVGKVLRISWRSLSRDAGFLSRNQVVADKAVAVVSLPAKIRISMLTLISSRVMPWAELF